MTLRSGLAGQIGFAEEVTYGVPVAPTLFLPLVSESLEAVHEPIEDESVYAGARLSRSGQYLEGNFAAGGDVGFKFSDKDMGLLLKHMFGNVVTTGPVSGLYTHTFTPGELTGKSLTVQKGVPGSSAGTVEALTYPGSKFSSWELAQKTKETATLGLTIAAKHEITYRQVTDGATTNASAAITSATASFSTSDEGKPISGAGIPATTTILSVQSATAATLSANATATASGVTFTLGVALGTASYSSNIYPMSFASASVNLAASAYRTKGWSLKCEMGLDDDRYFLGDRGRDEPLEAGIRQFTGQIDSEFFDISTYRRFLRNEEVALVLGLRRGTSTLTITMNVRFTGKTPNLDGTKVVQQMLPFKVYGTTTDALGITAVAVNADATP